MKLECYGCDTAYEYSSSNADTPSMYHSLDCELEDRQRLAMGNETVAKAQEANPLAFVKSKVIAIPNLNPGTVVPVAQTVDEVFAKLGLQTSKDSKSNSTEG